MKPKRLLLLLPLLLAGLVLAAATAPASAPPALPDTKIDVDLAAMNRTMVYSQVFDMIRNPGAYRGRTVRMKGAYATAFDPATSNRYHACLVSDAMACCAQGIEFAPTNAATYPADFPPEGGAILVQGVFDTYEEASNRYVRLRDAHLAFPRQPPAR